METNNKKDSLNYMCVLESGMARYSIRLQIEGLLQIHSY